MKYKVYLDAIQCDKFYCKIIRAFDLGISEYGVPVSISFTLEAKSKEDLYRQIDKVIEVHKMTKDEKSLEHYLTNIKLNRIEVIIDECEGKTKSFSDSKE